MRARTELVGIPRVSSGTKPPRGGGIVRRLGSRHPLDGPLAEPFGVLGYPFLDGIAHERGHRGHAAGQDPDAEAEAAAAR